MKKKSKARLERNQFAKTVLVRRIFICSASTKTRDACVRLYQTSRQINPGLGDWLKETTLNENCFITTRLPLKKRKREKNLRCKLRKITKIEGHFFFKPTKKY